MMDKTQRKIFAIDRVENIVTIKFLEGNKMGVYHQSLDNDGVDIQRVIASMDNLDENYLTKKASFKEIENKKITFCFTKKSAIRKLEKILGLGWKS